jgi:hypothetical protein
VKWIATGLGPTHTLPMRTTLPHCTAL